MIRVNQKPNLPLDPLQIKTMADYDLQLCLYRTWFEYDSSRKAKPGLVAEWTFDAKDGKYRFKISEDARWSDGSPITSSHLLNNLKRAVASGASHGAAIQGLIALDRALIIDDRIFDLPTVDRLPSERFFQRMGSSFLAPIHPDDWDGVFHVKSNRLTSGPYKISHIEPQALNLIVNPNDKVSAATRPKTVTIRFQAITDLVKFVVGAEWANVMQTSTLMPIELAERVKRAGLPYWTRGFDRVSRLMPLGSSPLIEKRRTMAVAFGAKWATLQIPDLPFNVTKAKSLQPAGYPLMTEIDYRPGQTQSLCVKTAAVRIVAQKAPQNDYQRPLVSKTFQTLGCDVEWISADSVGEMNDTIKRDPTIDFRLSSFGVADPEPTTWMGLILSEGSPFVDVVPSDLVTFKRIASLSSREEEVKQFQAVLREIGLRGSYVPLFHFSTLSVAQPGISFENIQELDETVDYSKLLFK